MREPSDAERGPEPLRVIFHCGNSSLTPRLVPRREELLFLNPFACPSWSNHGTESETPGILGQSLLTFAQRFRYNFLGGLGKGSIIGIRAEVTESITLFEHPSQRLDRSRYAHQFDATGTMHRCGKTTRWRMSIDEVLSHCSMKDTLKGYGVIE